MTETTTKHIEEITEGRTIWNSDGTDGPCLICPPPTVPPNHLAARVRTAYRAIDAIQTLQDRGRGSGNTERAMEAIRTVINDIENTPKRGRGDAT